MKFKIYIAEILRHKSDFKALVSFLYKLGDSDGLTDRILDPKF